MTHRISLEHLKQFLHYDPLTGLFTRLVQAGNQPVGAVVGTKRSNGYIQIQIDGVNYRAHRLAWFYVNGEWPEHDVDHRNTVRDDNHYDNLRPATRKVNLQNQRKAQAHNKVGLLGVRKHRGGKFTAQIKVDEKAIHLGTFNDPMQAHLAYVDAKREKHEGCTL